MNDKRKAYEERLDAQLEEWNQIALLRAGAANIPVRSLAEAIILQSIEDLWNPVCRRESLLFFGGEGFVLCSKIAGISYIKRLEMLRMLANARPKRVYTT
jgi:hypothetical protein